MKKYWGYTMEENKMNVQEYRHKPEQTRSQAKRV